MLKAGWHPRVLVVDDDEISRAAAAGLLQSLGLTVDTAVNGQEALEMSATWPYGAIFMDCEMPEVDGYTAVTQLHRREGANLHTPVIAVTSRPQWLSVAAGMDHHIAKPLEIGELRADCIRLGLLASEHGSASTPAADLGADTPLLDGSIFGEGVTGYRETKARHAAAFIEQATVRLPEIWRAANAGDGPALRRLALALEPRAQAVGAARISTLCGYMSEAAAGEAVAAGVNFDKALRQAVADTGPAIKAWVDGTEPPAVLKPQTPASSPGRAREPRGTAPSVSVRVVLADDDPVARAAIGAMLRTADWIDFVGDAEGVEHVVELVGAEQPDVVVLDWMMPGGGGTEAARRILGQRADTLIVGITSSDSLEALTEMISAGASCLVSKGGTADQLTQTIARALRASAAAQKTRDKTQVQPAPTGITPIVRDASSRGGPIDPEGVERLRADFGSTEVLGELVALFGSQTPDRLIQLRQAIDAGDAGAVSSHAHQLKGGCLTLTASRMAELCDELEESSRAGSLGGAGALVDQIQVAFEQAYAALRREVS